MPAGGRSAYKPPSTEWDLIRCPERDCRHLVYAGEVSGRCLWADHDPACGCTTRHRPPNLKPEFARYMTRISIVRDGEVAPVEAWTLVPVGVLALVPDGWTLESVEISNRPQGDVL